MWGFPGGAAVKISLASAGDAGNLGSVPGSGRSPGGGHGNTLQYSCLETEGPGGLQSMGSERVGHASYATWSFCLHFERILLLYTSLHC